MVICADELALDLRQNFCANLLDELLLRSVLRAWRCKGAAMARQVHFFYKTAGAYYN